MSDKIQGQKAQIKDTIIQEEDPFSDLKAINSTIKGMNRCLPVNKINPDYNLQPFEQSLPTLDLKLDSFDRAEEAVILPLYSKLKGKHVPERSGLNQWNARGRTRHPDEVYIPIPAAIHRESPTFFPGRDEPFDICLPNGVILSAKVCQQGRKALMSDPNKELGHWILRSVFKLSKYELLTLDHLVGIGFESVKVIKKNNIFYIDKLNAN